MQPRKDTGVNLVGETTSTVSVGDTTTSIWTVSRKTDKRGRQGTFQRVRIRRETRQGRQIY